MKKNKSILKKVIYYIFLTIAFLGLPLSIRNIYYSFYLTTNVFILLIDILLNILVFVYPFTIAMFIRYKIKHGKWPLPSFMYEEV